MDVYSTLHERELFMRIAGGDERAFHELFHNYNQQLVPFVFKLTHSESAAEDVLQEVFLKIWNNRQKLSDIQNPKAWIVRIVSNESMNFLRKQAIEGRLLQALQQSASGEPSSPAEELAAKELARVFRQGIEELSPQVRQVYLLHKEQGLSVSQIADQLGVSPNTVKNQLVTALKKIRMHVQRSLIFFLVWLIGHG